jgi:hypothetical protein
MLSRGPAAHTRQLPQAVRNPCGTGAHSSMWSSCWNPLDSLYSAADLELALHFSTPGKRGAPDRTAPAMASICWRCRVAGLGRIATMTGAPGRFRLHQWARPRARPSRIRRHDYPRRSAGDQACEVAGATTTAPVCRGICGDVFRPAYSGSRYTSTACYCGAVRVRQACAAAICYAFARAIITPCHLIDTPTSRRVRTGSPVCTRQPQAFPSGTNAAEYP